MNEMHFSPGHLGILGSLLDANKSTISPRELAERALARSQVDRALSGLAQEIGNTSGKIELLEYVVDAIADKTASLTPETLPSLLDDLDSYERAMDDAERNGQLIIECMNLLREANQIRLDQGQESLISDEGWRWISNMLKDEQNIRRVLEEKGEHFADVYRQAVLKIQGLHR